MNKCPVSVIIAAYQEERNIEDCLKSAAFADEIIVVDGGSRDRTRELAKSLGATVIETENAPAETQRLKALKGIRNDWFFLLDADERITPELAEKITQSVKDAEAKAAYFVLRLNYYRGKPVNLHHPDYQMRLFQKTDSLSLPEKIHRIPEPAGEVGKLSEGLIHYFFPSVHEYLEKINFYTTKEASYLKGLKPVWNVKDYLMYLCVRPVGRFLQYYFFKRGCLDGFFGLFYAASSAYYEWAVAAKCLIADETDHKASN